MKKPTKRHVFKTLDEARSFVTMVRADSGWQMHENKKRGVVIVNTTLPVESPPNALIEVTEEE